MTTLSDKCRNSTREHHCGNPPRLGHIYCDQCRVNNGGLPLWHAPYIGKVRSAPKAKP
jgi:hypothetical protein